MEYEGDVGTNCYWCIWTNPQRIGKGSGRLGNKRTNRDHPNYSIIKIGQNPEKSPGDMRGTCCHSNSSDEISTNVSVKNSLERKIKKALSSTVFWFQDL